MKFKRSVYMSVRMIACTFVFIDADQRWKL